jgi:hypothetical protein
VTLRVMLQQTYRPLYTTNANELSMFFWDYLLNLFCFEVSPGTGRLN